MRHASHHKEWCQNDALLRGVEKWVGNL